MYDSHNGNTLTGEGEQTRYNGKMARHHYPIKITEGTMLGNEVIIRFSMKGGRNTTGMFKLTLDPHDENILSGTFASSAAQTKGTTVVRVVGSTKN